MSAELLVDDGGFAGVVYLLKMSRESRAHGSNVPACDTKSWCLRCCFPFVTAWYEVVTRLSGRSPKPFAPSRGGELWRGGTTLAGRAGWKKRMNQVWNQGFSSPRWAAYFAAKDPQLPRATGFEAPVARLRPFSCQWCQFRPVEARSWPMAFRGYLRRTLSEGL